MGPRQAGRFVQNTQSFGADFMLVPASYRRTPQRTGRSVIPPEWVLRALAVPERPAEAESRSLPLRGPVPEPTISADPPDSRTGGHHPADLLRRCPDVVREG